MINPSNLYTAKNGTEYVTLAVGWKNDDDSITLVLKEYLRPDQKIRVFFNRFKQEGTKQPDFKLSVERSLYDEEAGEIKRKESVEAVADQIPF